VKSKCNNLDSESGNPTEKNTGKNIVRDFPHPTGKSGSED